jgi:hypothetical protein
VLRLLLHFRWRLGGFFKTPLSLVFFEGHVRILAIGA